MDLGIPNIFLTNQKLLKKSWQIHDIFPKFPTFLTIPDIPDKVDTLHMYIVYLVTCPMQKKSKWIKSLSHAYCNKLQFQRNASDFEPMVYSVEFKSIPAQYQQFTIIY